MLQRLKSQTGTIHAGILRSCFGGPFFKLVGYP
jgi:hypothetical protein